MRICGTSVQRGVEVCFHLGRKTVLILKAYVEVLMHALGRKVGRNEQCPCGSGKKYKKCHGALVILDRAAAVAKAAPFMLSRFQALDLQRRRQQGEGRPIISTEMNGHRFVAVKNRLLQSKKWGTFHDFLGDYVKMAIGPEWGNAEIAKPLAERHPILQWYDYVCRRQREIGIREGHITTGAMTGAVAAYMHLAYDLYALDHNAEVQERLLKRLRDVDNFAGARYEVHVAAILIRAGFHIEMEDEADRATTHCEFTATFASTGKKFSVEAKHSEAGQGRLVRQLNRALIKAAKRQRIIFIDINSPDTGESDEPTLMLRTLRMLRKYEERDPRALTLPPAYVLVTNTPWVHHLESERFRCSALGEGFRIPEFKEGAAFESLRSAIDARAAQMEMHELLKSMKREGSIPSTFDGSMPELAFGNHPQRLLVGERYVVPDTAGVEQVGLLTSAVVHEVESSAACVMELEDGSHVILKIPMTDAEVAAWKANPDTFFGFVDANKGQVKDVLELYDFLFETYSKTPREKLLEFLASAHDVEELMLQDQATLASIYCERMASAMFAQRDASRPSPESVVNA
jgi:hypothetical protein